MYYNVISFDKWQKVKLAGLALGDLESGRIKAIETRNKTIIQYARKMAKPNAKLPKFSRIVFRESRNIGTAKYPRSIVSYNWVDIVPGITWRETEKAIIIDTGYNHRLILKEKIICVIRFETAQTINRPADGLPF